MAWRRKGGWLNRVSLCFLPISAFVVFQRAAFHVLSSPCLGNSWYPARLAPSLALFYGYPVYCPPGAGPVQSTVYGPVFFLLNAPLTLTGSVTASIVLGVLASALFFFIPVFCLHFMSFEGGGPGRPAKWAGFVLFCLMALSYQPMHSAAFAVHPESLAAGMSAAAFAILFRKRRRGSVPWLATASVLAVLAVWSKQTYLPVLLLLPAYVGLMEGKAAARRTLWCEAGAVSTTTAVLLVAFDPGALYFNMVTVPFNHPWTGPDRSSALDQAAVELVTQFGLVLLLFLTVLVVLSRKWVDRKDNLRQWLDRNPWVVLAAVGAFMAPSSILGRVKVGSFFNALNPTLYFLAAGVTLGVVYLGGARGGRAGGAASGVVRSCAALLAASMLWLQLPDPRWLSTVVRDLPANPDSQAYDFDRHNPGRAYFPANPLPVLMAEGNLYHFAYGLFDRDIAGYQISMGHFRSHIPAGSELVALPPGYPEPWARSIMQYLPEYRLPVRVTELPGWAVFARHGTQPGASAAPSGPPM